MKQSINEVSFEQAFSVLNLATWNRPRTSSEIQSFIARREAAVVEVEL